VFLTKLLLFLVVVLVGKRIGLRDTPRFLFNRSQSFRLLAWISRSTLVHHILHFTGFRDNRNDTERPGREGSESIQGGPRPMQRRLSLVFLFWNKAMLKGQY
jgi:hypothetical protein